MKTCDAGSRTGRWMAAARIVDGAHITIHQDLARLDRVLMIET
jgi:hypothetical protein